MAHISIDWSSIKLQRRSKLSFAHPREIVARIHVSRSTEEEFVKSFDRMRMQRINRTSKGNLCKKRFGAWNSHRFEVIREYPCPVRNEVKPSEGHVRITAGHHLGDIAMHDAEATWKIPHLRGEEDVSRGFSQQCVGGGTALGTNVPCIR